MTNEQEKISELEQRNLALAKDKEDLLKLNANLNKHLESLTSEKEQLELELCLANLKAPLTSLSKNNPLTTKIDQQKSMLIIFLLVVLAGALLFK